MTEVVVAKEIAIMWKSYQRLSSVWYTLERPDVEINDSILDVIAEDPTIGAPSSLVMFGNYLKFMLSSQRDGIVFAPTEERFRDWYRGGTKP